MASMVGAGVEVAQLWKWDHGNEEHYMLLSPCLKATWFEFAWCLTRLDDHVLHGLMCLHGVWHQGWLFHKWPHKWPLERSPRNVGVWWSRFGCIIYLHVLVDLHVNAFVSIVNCFDSLLFSLALGTGAHHPLHCDAPQRGRIPVVLESCIPAERCGADLFSHVPTCMFLQASFLMWLACADDNRFQNLLGTQHIFFLQVQDPKAGSACFTCFSHNLSYNVSLVSQFACFTCFICFSKMS